MVPGCTSPPSSLENLRHRAHDHLCGLEAGPLQVALNEPPADRVAAHVRDADGSDADSFGHEVAQDIRRPLLKATARVARARHLLERGVTNRARDVGIPGARRLRTADLDRE